MDTVLHTKFIYDENGNKIEAIISIEEYNEYKKLKEQYLFGEPYEETEDDLFLSDEDKKDIEEIRNMKDKKTLEEL
jgi:hypothetical protein